MSPVAAAFSHLAHPAGVGGEAQLVHQVGQPTQHPVDVNMFHPPAPSVNPLQGFANAIMGAAHPAANLQADAQRAMANPAFANPGPYGETHVTDEGHTQNVIEHLMQAIQRAKDPTLKESLSNALAALHKHAANFQKEREQALQGKISPRILAQATVAPPSGHVDTGYNPAQTQLAMGNTAQAAADWEAHHPYAMSHGQVPGWVENYILSLLPHPAQAAPAYTNAPAPGLAVS